MATDPPEDGKTGRRSVLRGRTRRVSAEFGVTTVFSRGGPVQLTRKEPCTQCPFRSDIPPGQFPAEAFRESAHTAYDAATNSFACHMSRLSAPATCAGFLMLHADNNLGARLAQMTGRLDLSEVSDGGFPLYRSYREMAIANGVDADEAVLRPIRGNGDGFYRPGQDEANG